KAEYEADEFGVMTGLANAFSTTDQKKIEEIGNAWEKELSALQKAIGNPENDFSIKRKEVLTFIEAWLPKNAEFLEMVTTSFMQRLRIDKNADLPPAASAA